MSGIICIYSLWFLVHKHRYIHYIYNCSCQKATLCLSVHLYFVRILLLRHGNNVGRLERENGRQPKLKVSLKWKPIEKNLIFICPQTEAFCFSLIIRNV